MKSRFLCKGLSQPWDEVLCDWGRGRGRGQAGAGQLSVYTWPPRGSQPCSGSPLAPLAGQGQPTPQYRFRKRDKAMLYGRNIMRKVARAAGPGLLPLRGVGTAGLCLGAVQRLWGSGRVWGGHGWAEAFGEEAPSPREVDMNWKGGQKPPARSIPDVWRVEGPGSGAEIAGPTRIWGQAPRGGNCKASLASVKTHLGRSSRVQPVQQPGPLRPSPPEGRRSQQTA